MSSKVLNKTGWRGPRPAAGAPAVLLNHSTDYNCLARALAGNNLLTKIQFRGMSMTDCAAGAAGGGGCRTIPPSQIQVCVTTESPGLHMCTATFCMVVYLSSPHRGSCSLHLFTHPHLMYALHAVCSEAAG